MPETELKLFKRCIEFRDRSEIKEIPSGVRGICALLRWRPKLRQYDVVCVGMARRGVKARLRSHARTKRDLWTHFSIFEVSNLAGESNPEHTDQESDWT